jgi:hypothetical protein
MGGFYTVYFTIYLIFLIVWLRSRAIGQLTLLFSSLRNTSKSFINFSGSSFVAALALGIHLKIQSV